MAKNASKTEEITSDNCLGIAVSGKVFEQIKNGETDTVQVYVNEDNYKDILTNVDGNLLVCSDELPMTFHSCFWWNNGEFPYLIREDLKFLLLIDGDRYISTRILSATPLMGRRFRFGEEGEPSIKDPNGDSCEWSLNFKIEVLNVIEQTGHNTFLLRWNPAISSFKMDTYQKATTQCLNGFYLNWSVHEWGKAHKGDHYYMVRVGEGDTGIVWHGTFESDPYTDKDWSGTSKKRYYVDMSCVECATPEGPAWISTDELKAEIPEINWNRGHSGEMISQEATDKLDFMFHERIANNTSKQKINYDKKTN